VNFSYDNFFGKSFSKIYVRHKSDLSYFFESDFSKLGPRACTGAIER